LRKVGIMEEENKRKVGIMECWNAGWIEGLVGAWENSAKP
jgi:hypothetical protein